MHALTSWLKALEREVHTAEDREAYAQSIYGIEKKQFPYMLCVTNMLLHDIEMPHVYHDNSLAKDVLNYTDDDKFDVILMNPPYGGNEKNDVKRHFPSNIPFHWSYRSRERLTALPSHFISSERRQMIKEKPGTP